MKISILGRDLQRAMSVVMAVGTNSINSPILQATEIRASGGSATFTAYGGQSARVTVPADGDGVAYVTTLALAAKVKTLRQTEAAEISISDATVSVRQGMSRWTLPALVGDGFPEWRGVDGDPTEVGEDFFAALKIADGAAPAGDSRPALNGVLIDAGCVVATDGCYLALEPVAIKSRIGILPKQSVGAINGLFNEAQMRADDRAIMFTADGIEFRTTMIETPYLDYRRAIPAKFDGHNLVTAADMEAAVSRAAAVTISGKSALSVNLDAADGGIALTTDNKNGESGEDFVASKSDGDPIRTAMATRFLLAALRSMPADEIQIDHISGSLIKIHHPDRPDAFRIVMAMRRA